ncbi:MAG: hypothetical protein GXO30_08995 [Epsilonproteobacteria bacterium]|nr:hypothetical protein [Campylobacterota bacterium]
MNYKRKGFALSIVLWIVAVLLIGIAFIASLSKESLHVSYMLKDKLATQIIAKNYLEAIKYHVMISDCDGMKLINKNPIFSLPKEINLDGSEYHISNNITISIQDLSSMVRPYDLYSIVDMIKHRELSFTIKDSIRDWLDVDDNVRLNGAESTYYTIQKQLGYRPSNINIFQSLDELKLVKGINDIDENIIEKTTYKEGIINLMLINARYLKALFHISMDEANKLVSMRHKDSKKFVSIIEQNKYFDDSYMWFGISQVVNIKITVMQHKAKSQLYATLYFAQNDKNRVFYIEGYRIY